MIVRWSTPLSTADLNVRGYEPPTGPVLTGAPWDDLLVTEARSPDGARLRLCLEPWDDAVPAATLVLDQLDAGREYRIAGIDGEPRCTAADDGTSRVTISVVRPLALTIEPAEGDA